MIEVTKQRIHWMVANRSVDPTLHSQTQNSKEINKMDAQGGVEDKLNILEIIRYRSLTSRDGLLQIRSLTHQVISKCKSIGHWSQLWSAFHWSTRLIVQGAIYPQGLTFPQEWRQWFSWSPCYRNKSHEIRKKWFPTSLESFFNSCGPQNHSQKVLLELKRRRNIATYFSVNTFIFLTLAWYTRKDTRYLISMSFSYKHDTYPRA